MIGRLVPFEDRSPANALFSCMTNFHCPSSMIFVPSKDGVSHNPVEYTSPEDCAIGAQVILGALLRYDALRAKNASE